MPINPTTPIRTTRDLATLIRSTRKSQGLTQLDLAGLAGFSNRFIIDLEKGKETLQIQKVLQVMALLGMQINVGSTG